MTTLYELSDKILTALDIFQNGRMLEAEKSRSTGYHQSTN